MDDTTRKAVAAALRTLAEAIDVADAKPVGPQKEPKYMSLAGFGARVGYSRSTIRTWVNAGMPSVPSGRGHRVCVAAAEQWIAAGGARESIRLLAIAEAKKAS